jgi:hypothetical protein
MFYGRRKMAKEALIKFDNSFFITKTCTPSLLMEILNNLPADTIVESLLVSVNSGISGFLVSNDLFVDTLQPKNIPELDVYFACDNCTGELLVERVDCSRAFVPSILRQMMKITGRLPTRAPGTYGNPFKGSGGYVFPHSAPKITATLHYIPKVTYNGQSVPWTPGTSCIIDGNGSSSKIGSCSHNWTNYQGLSETFEYCKKCNEKRK